MPVIQKTKTSRHPSQYPGTPSIHFSSCFPFVFPLTCQCQEVHGHGDGLLTNLIVLPAFVLASATRMKGGPVQCMYVSVKGQNNYQYNILYINNIMYNIDIYHDYHISVYSYMFEKIILESNRAHTFAPRPLLRSGA